MFAVIHHSGDTYPVESIAPEGVYLTIAGHIRYFAAALVTVIPFTF